MCVCVCVCVCSTLLLFGLSRGLLLTSCWRLQVLHRWRPVASLLHRGALLVSQLTHSRCSKHTHEHTHESFSQTTDRWRSGGSLTWLRPWQTDRWHPISRGGGVTAPSRSWGEVVGGRGQRSVMIWGWEKWGRVISRAQWLTAWIVQPQTGTGIVGHDWW